MATPDAAGCSAVAAPRGMNWAGFCRRPTACSLRSGRSRQRSLLDGSRQRTLLGALLAAAALLQLDNANAGSVLDPGTRLSLRHDGLMLMPNALSPSELQELNAIVRQAIGNLENNTQTLSPLALTKLARGNLNGRRANGAANNGLFCFGDITQRDPGKYEVRAFYDPDRQEDLLPEFVVNSPRWLRTVNGELGPDAELRSATVILSASKAMVTNETATTQHWHSDGSLAKNSLGNLVLDPYALVV